MQQVMPREFLKTRKNLIRPFCCFFLLAFPFTSHLHSQTNRNHLWDFDDPEFRTESGLVPFLTENLEIVQRRNGRALKFTRVPGSGILSYSVKQSLFQGNEGSIGLLYKPVWKTHYETNPTLENTGNGPGDWACLWDAGTDESPFPAVRYTLSVSPKGTHILLRRAQKNSEPEILIRAPILWFHFHPVEKSPWHEIIVIFSKLKTQLVVDGRQIGTGPGLKAWPLSPESKDTLSFGNARDGSAPCRGILDEVETFNFQMGSAQTRYFRRWQLGKAWSASVSENPRGLRMQWTSMIEAPLSLERRQLPSTTWTTVSAHLMGTNFLDTTIEPGERYEYKFGGGSLFAGLQARPIEDRGQLLLLVDETLSKSLDESIAQLKRDLVGDGWSVKQFKVPRHDDRQWKNYRSNLQKTKSLIISELIASPDKHPVVYLLGHITVPYSGYQMPDGHPDHLGAYPADGFLGDLDGIWTDRSVDQRNTVYPWMSNAPGDGKFDQLAYPGELEASVGRVDFANLPALTKNRRFFQRRDREIGLLKNYLEKIHRYRQGRLTFEMGSLVKGDFHDNSFHTLNQSIYLNAVRNSSKWFGFEYKF
ncbi:MAG TPA: hypothetical protein EYQ50_14525, partial [Verrucomicrobiales bacterium]|nr:hypothetical protein [Verrucomicrobiales bacterium]